MGGASHFRGGRAVEGLARDPHQLGAVTRRRASVCENMPA